ncbi:MAG: ATP-binding protein, partial [Microcystaceae cyanobacterium]
WLQESSPLLTADLTTNSQTSAVNEVLDWLEQVRPGFVALRPWFECQTALIEGLDNVIQHAHPHLSPETAIALELRVYPQGIEMKIWDYGEPFDLLNYLEQVPEKQAESAERGRGFILMRRILDYITYTRTDDGRNQLRMIKVF